MEILTKNDFAAVIEFDFIELIGLYKLSMAKTDPTDIFHGDDDVLAITARLQVQLAGIVGP